MNYLSHIYNTQNKKFFNLKIEKQNEQFGLVIPTPNEIFHPISNEILLRLISNTNIVNGMIKNAITFFEVNGDIEPFETTSQDVEIKLKELCINKNDLELGASVDFFDIMDYFQQTNNAKAYFIGRGELRGSKAYVFAVKVSPNSQTLTYIKKTSFPRILNQERGLNSSEVLNEQSSLRAISF